MAKQTVTRVQVDIEKGLYRDFKSMCAQKGLTIREAIEKLMKVSVEKSHE
jgi:hypothetical protein